jgi:anthranilate phosphoribosyltransferase
MKEVLARVMKGERLSEDEAGRAMAAIMDGEATPAQIGALLAALAVRGEAEDEVVGFARTMRARAAKVEATDAVDTCGTGGDGSGTFNISTIASLVVGACGVNVAKHGNRSSSGAGSADVLEALGMRLDVPVSAVQRSLDETGWAFLFAPAFHASTRHAVGPRKEIGVRTVFNLLGPLTNPAKPHAQVLGVPRPDLVPFIARCLQRLGVRRAWVVHSAGLDELSLAAPTLVAVVDGDDIRTLEVSPADAGLKRADLPSLRGGSAADNAEIARAVLSGATGPHRDVVLLNAAAALLVARRATSLREAAGQAAEAIDDGRAERLLSRVVEVSRS